MKHDLELTELLFLIRNEAGTLNYFDREKKTAKLYAVLENIHVNSRKAMYRMNDLAEKERNEKAT